MHVTHANRRRLIPIGDRTYASLCIIGHRPGITAEVLRPQLDKLLYFLEEYGGFEVPRLDYPPQVLPLLRMCVSAAERIAVRTEYATAIAEWEEGSMFAYEPGDDAHALGLPKGTDQFHPMGWDQGIGIEEVSCGTVDQVRRDLAEATPDLYWTLSEDPRYDFLGSLAWHAPDLGLFTADCTADGDPVFTADDVMRLSGNLAGHGSYTWRELERETGKTWLDAFAAIRGEA